MNQHSTVDVDENERKARSIAARMLGHTRSEWRDTRLTGLELLRHATNRAARMCATLVIAPGGDEAAIDYARAYFLLLDRQVRVFRMTRKEKTA